VGASCSVAPVFVPFAAVEWMLITGSGSFAGLLGFIGVIVVSLVAGIYPVLLLVASRRKGDYVPMVVHRWLGHPVLLAGLYLVFLGSLLLHGLVIWDDPADEEPVRGPVAGRRRRRSCRTSG
jgi:hypothetical protein